MVEAVDAVISGASYNNVVDVSGLRRPESNQKVMQFFLSRAQLAYITGKITSKVLVDVMIPPLLKLVKFISDETLTTPSRASTDRIRCQLVALAMFSSWTQSLLIVLFAERGSVPDPEYSVACLDSMQRVDFVQAMYQAGVPEVWSFAQRHFGVLKCQSWPLSRNCIELQELQKCLRSC